MKTQKELGNDICNYCPRTEMGEKEIPIHIMDCDGEEEMCEVAYSYYVDEQEAYSDDKSSL